MNPKYLYLTLDIASLLLPLMFSFYPQANFSRKWRYVIPSIIVTGILFIAWDEAFTRLGIWGFNPKYMTGVYILSLPLEEVLFFICIPYACHFIYHAVTHLVKTDYLFRYQNQISNVLIIVLLLGGIIFIERSYTSFTFLVTAAFLIGQRLLLKPNYMGRFYFAFLFILVPFFLVNGILTGTFIDEPLVWYNNDENLRIRLGTIPVEDIVYGMLLILMSVTVAEELSKRLPSRQ